MKRIFILLALLMTVQLAQAEEEKSLPKKIGDGVKKGGEAAGRGIEKGADATVKGLKKAGEWVGKEMEKGGEKLQKESK
jgi:hypothetical protein